MSIDHADTHPEPPTDDPLDTVAENRDLFERIADADLPISDACQRALEKLDARNNGGGA